MTGRDSSSLWALVVADTAFAFQQTAVVPAFPLIQSDLHASEEWTAWLLSGYLVVASVAGPVLGKAADRHGKRLVLLSVLGVFLAASGGAAVAPTLAVLILCRALQGIGGAVFPLSIAIARDAGGGVSRSVGLLTGAFGLGALLGLGLGGVIAQSLGWRALFVVGAAVTAGATVVTARLVAPSPVRTPRRLDVPGGLLFGGALGAVIVGLTELPGRGGTNPATLGAFVAAVALGVAWARRELTTDQPMLDLRVLRTPAVLYTNLASALLGYVLFGVFFLVPFLAERSANGVGRGAVAAGVYLVPSAVGQLAGGPLSGRLQDRFGPRRPFLAGLLLLVAGCLLLTAARSPWGLVMGAMLLLGVGYGLAIGVASTLVTVAVDRTETGVSTALNSVLRRVGGGVGGQVAATLLASVGGTGGRPSGGAFTAAFALCAGAAVLAVACGGLATAEQPR